MGQVTEMEEHEGIVPKEGTASELVYLVEYDEDQWMKYSEEDKQYCMDTWIKKAEPLEVERVVVRIHPDILFPRYGNQRPYIDRQHRFPKAEKGWETSKHLKVQTNTDQVSLTDADLERIQQYQKDGYNVEVRNCNGVKLW